MRVFEFDRTTGHVGKQIDQTDQVPVLFQPTAPCDKGVPTRKNSMEFWKVTRRCYWPGGGLVKYGQDVCFCLGPLWIGDHREAKQYEWLAVLHPVNPDHDPVLHPPE